MRPARSAAPRTMLLLSTAAMVIAIAAAACGGKKGASTIDHLKIDQTMNLPGLDGAVDVVRDEFGRPHVYATTVHDLAEVTGWLHTEDRFIQMDMQRRAASGRLAELVGAALPSAIDLDKRFHVVGLHRAAKKHYDSLAANSELKIALDAYTVGVNAKLATFTQPPVPEYTIFQYNFADTPPWTPVDSLTVGRLLAFELDWAGDDEISFADDVAKATAFFTTGAHAGFVNDTFLHFTPPELVTIVDPSLPFAARPATLPVVSRLPRTSLSRARAAHDALMASPLAKFFSPEKGIGSNDWVVGPSKTASHHPILCNDPHLGLTAPPVWYELHWNTVKHGGDLDVTGVSFPGVPGIILGGNGHVAWGVTNVGPDATDTYIEHYSIGTGSNGVDQVLWDDDGPTGGHAPAYVDLVKDTAAIVVRTGLGTTTTVMDTVWLVPHRNGVIVRDSLVVDTALSMVTGTALSWAWTGFNVTHEVEAFFQLLHAKNAADVFAADALFEAAPQNMVYADTSGSIGYVANGWFPIRGDDDGDLHTDPPFLPMPGWNGAHEWIGRIPTAQVPQELNPARGWEASANQDPTGGNADGDVLNDATYIAFDFDIGFRGARIARVLDGESNITVADMQKLQADHHSNFGARLVPFALQSLASSHPAQAAILQGWSDRGFNAASGVGDALPAAEVDDSAATSLFNAWAGAMRTRAFGDETAASGADFGQYESARTLLFLLEHPTQAASYDAVTGESALWDDINTPAVESRDDIFRAAMDDALAFLASSDGFNSADPTNWRWGLLHTVNFSRQSGLSPYDIPKGVDGQNFPNGYPRHSDEFNVDVGNPGIDDFKFGYGTGASMREIIDLTPGRMRVYNQIPGGISADPQSPHYADRAPEYAKNISRESWYRESDVASHGKSRVQFLAGP